MLIVDVPVGTSEPKDYKDCNKFIAKVVPASKPVACEYSEK